MLVQLCGSGPRTAKRQRSFTTQAFRSARSLMGVSVAIWRSLLPAGAVLLLPVAAHAGTAVVGGTVHTMTSPEPLENATVLIGDDGRIEAVGTDVAVPTGYQRVDAAGRVVTPGLIESHSQLGLVEISGEATTVDARVTTVIVGDQPPALERFRLGPAFDIQYAVNPDSTLLPVSRMDGVTRAVVAPLHGNDPLSGWGAAIRLADSDVLVRPRLALFGAIGSDSAMYVGGSRSAVIQRLRYALEEARDYRPGRHQPDEGGYTARELEALGGFLDAEVPLVLTVHRANEIREALAIARDFDLRLIVNGGTEAWKVADQLAAAEVPVILDVLANLPLSYDRLGARLDNATILHEAGVPVLIAAEDTHNARLLRQNAGNAVTEGMPWVEALAAITRRPAEAFGLPSGTGTLAAGAPADLVIWTGDPLELTTWAERVMIDGEWMSMESRQTRLLERYRTLEGQEPFGYR